MASALSAQEAEYAELMAARAPAPAAAEASPLFRPGAVLMVRYFPEFRPRWPSQCLYGPRPSEAARKLCESLDVPPHTIKVKPGKELGFPFRLVNLGGDTVAVLGIEPGVEAFADKLNAALRQLDVDRWSPPPLPAAND